MAFRWGLNVVRAGSRSGWRTESEGDNEMGEAGEEKMDLGGHGEEESGERGALGSPRETLPLEI